MMTDPVADMLTRIRNAILARKEYVDVPASRTKISIARIMKDEGYIRNFRLAKDRKQGIIRIHLKYDKNNTPAIDGLRRVSKPSRRYYVKYGELPKVMNGLGIAIVSTSKGIMTDREARKNRVGGEVLCEIW